MSTFPCVLVMPLFRVRVGGHGITSELFDDDQDADVLPHLPVATKLFLRTMAWATTCLPVRSPG
jgi:hypothetical protein